MDLILYCVTFVSAIIIGILAVLMGGTLFLSFPLFQILFPELSLAAIVGNIKIGSVFRNIAALVPTYKAISYKVLIFAPALCVGSIIGTWQVIHFPAWLIPIVLVVGLLVHEYGKSIEVPKSLLFSVTILIGVYGGIFGAGIMLLLLVLLQVTQQSLTDARVNALLLELIVSLVAVVVFMQADIINWPLAVIWSAGSMIGGYIGGVTIKKTVNWSLTTQTWLVRTAFLIALLVSLGKLYTT